MPSLTASHMYTFIALVAVSSLLVFAFVDYADALRISSELKQLKNLMNLVAAKSTELMVLTLTTNASTAAFIQMPTIIGNTAYWIQLRNDSTGAWVEAGLGDVPTGAAELRAYLPEEASASGYYVSGHGAARLSCQSDSVNPQIKLTSSSEVN